jgi:hypothetical protein
MEIFSKNINSSLAYTLSHIAALLLVGASLSGLFFQTVLYPSEELRLVFVPNDLVNLIVGLPILLGSMALARRGRLVGLLLWPGALFYNSHNYLAYAAAMPPWSLQFPLYLSLVLLSSFVIILLLAGMDVVSIRQRLEGAVPERLGGGVLAGLGALILVRSLTQGAGVLTGQVQLTAPETSVLVADQLIVPFWIAGGILLWRKQPYGYAAGAGLLFQASMLFVGLLFFFILQPFMTGMPFQARDFLVVLLMGMVCFIPFGLYSRGIQA